MKSIENLQNFTINLETLESYLLNNFDKIYDYFSLQKHRDLVKYKEELRRYVALNILKLQQLDKTNTNNLSFLALLLDVTERVGLSAQYKLLYDLLENIDFDFGSRLKASALYLIDVDNFNNHLERYNNLFYLLQLADESEGDSKDKLLATVINYYSKILIDFGQFFPEGVQQVKVNLLTTIANDSNSFLNHELVESVLGIDISDFENAYLEIHFLLDSYLGREVIQPIYNPNYLIEKDSEYINKLEKANSNFFDIREISVKFYNLIRDDSIYFSLQRGVKILTKEAQLYAYMYSFGNMHYEKLVSAYKALPNEVLVSDLNIIDWGCGQATATMTYFDYLKYIGIEKECKYCTLIEPSEIALMRASAHVSKYYPEIKIHTVNKPFDLVNDDDLINIPKTANLHLLSNVIDMDIFPFGHIFELIESSFKGENYFVCVSPFVDDLRTNRLNAFMNHFLKNIEFEDLKSVNNRKGEWKNGWSRVIRVFKCII